jgi:phospholipase/carboxylesterase
VVPEILEAIEIETGPAPRASIVWMHGLGADGNDFVPIVPELGLPDTRPVRFVFPHAPMRPVAINQGYVMRAWYDIVDQDGAWREDAASVRESGRLIEALLEREKARGIPAGRLVLAGFSQGGAMALYAGPRHGERLAGVLALSCALPLADTLAAEASPANRDVPVFMAHGTRDPVVPISRGARSRDILTGLGYRVTWREYPMPHSVCPEEVDAIAGWLAGVLA